MNIVNKRALSVLLSFALLIGMFCISAPASVKADSTDPIILLQGNSDWKYYDKGMDQGTVWQSTYNDTTWSSGSAPFGYKDNGSGVTTGLFGPLKTTVDYGSNKSKKYPTTYFRKVLNVEKSKIDAYDQILGTFAIDDGAVIYVNGTEITRFGMPDGEITYTTKATSGKDLPVIYDAVDLTAALKTNLHDGDNELAIEVHQQSDGSSDLYFDMKLVAVADAPVVANVSKVTVTFNGDPTSSKGFTWYTSLDSNDSDLQVVEKTGTTPDFTKATAFTGRSTKATNSAQENVHKAEATGLKANTTYFFRVGDKKLNSWSATGTFLTAPKSGAFSFIDMTDTQAQDEEEAAISAATLSKALATVPNAKFVLHNGDVVEHGTTEQEWNWLLGHSQQSLLNTTIVPAAGNHEESGNAFFEHFDIKQQENSDISTGAYYSYDYSNAHVIVLNSNEKKKSTIYDNFSDAQVEWMKQDVQAAKAAGAQWILVNIHKGPYTTANHATDSDISGANGERNKIAPLMNELGIDFVFQGHDHIYARTKPIMKDGSAEAVEKITETLNGQTIEYAVKPDGTVYLIPAAAGAKVYFKNTKLDAAYLNLFERAEENHAKKYGDTTTIARGQVQNFVSVTIDKNKMTAVSYEIDKNINNGVPFIIDQFGIVKEEVAEPDPVVEVSKVTVTFNGDPTSAKGFTWYTSLESTDSDLQVVEKTGTTPDFTKATAFTGRSSKATNSAQENVHKAEAAGLKANTTYFFRVGDAKLNSWSKTGTFLTAPTSGAFSFIDMTDTQAQDEEEAAISAATLSKALATVPNAKFVLHNGDVVEHGTTEQEWNWLLGHSQPSLLNTTIVPAAGNHEESGNAFFEHFDIKKAENSDTSTGAYYSYDYSNAHVIVLNSNEKNKSTVYDNFSDAQVEWMKQDVQAAKAAGAQWILVNIHKGPYTTANHATDSDISGAKGERNKIAPLMNELGIDFVFQGHDHIYARTKPIMKDGKAETVEKITEVLNGQTIEYAVKPDGTIYLIPAAAGAKVYFKNTKLDETYLNLFERAEENHAKKYGDTTTKARGQVQNFVGVTIDGNKMTAVSYEIDKNINNGVPFIIDQFGIVKNEETYGYSISTPQVSVTGLSATVSATIQDLKNVSEKATVIFQLMDGNTPIQLVSIKNDIQDAQEVTAQFNLPSFKNYTVKVLLWDDLQNQVAKAQPQDAAIAPSTTK
ncbi:metallophosphoesterase [Paenibacillus alba]|uniref:Metallophosphoesterase n=1 Tax=Paenibacillus alba TaxID=1197127 RepID=A0ABU6FXE6_9BACL|nr:metallophosphoesterase [Paenibacillus alba]MEC0226579.1 metallophosphoesterase [Paenibacillus alba]